MADWKIQQMVCVLNYPSYFEIGEMTDDFKKCIHDLYGSDGNIDYEAPQMMGPVQIVNHAYRFKHGEYSYTVNLAPDSISIMAQNSEVVVDNDFDAKTDKFLGVAKKIWEIFNNKAGMPNIVRAGLVAAFTADTVVHDSECTGQWPGFYCSKRLFKFDEIEIEQGKKISVVDNIFYDFENDMKTFKPLLSKNVIDIALLPNSRGVANASSVSDVLDKMQTRLCACKRKMFDAK